MMIVLRRRLVGLRGLYLGVSGEDMTGSILFTSGSRSSMIGAGFLTS